MINWQCPFPHFFTAPLFCFSCLPHKVIKITAVPHHEQVLCSGAINSLNKLYVERLLDNLIPPGDLVKPLSLLIFTLSLIQAPSLFLCLHNVGFLSFLFYVPLYRFFPSPASTPKPSDSMQLMQIIGLLFSILVLRLQ